jgi:hypothetical protein
VDTLADEELPSAVNVFDVSNVSAAVHPTVATVLVVSCLASLLNVAGFSPVTGFPTV